MVVRTTMLSGLWHCCLNSKQMPADEARAKRKETSFCFCVGTCLWVLLGIANQSQHLAFLLVIIKHFRMRYESPARLFLGSFVGIFAKTNKNVLRSLMLCLLYKVFVSCLGGSDRWNQIITNCSRILNFRQEIPNDLMATVSSLSIRPQLKMFFQFY